MNTLPAIVDQPTAPAARDVDTDDLLTREWRDRSQSDNTRANYDRQARQFREYLAKPLRECRVSDVQNYLATLVHRSPATRALAVSAVKSLLTFGFETGYLPLNVGKAVKAPAVKNTLAERIMAEPDAMRMIALEPSDRNRALLTLTYGGGLRASEVTALRWRDLAARDGEAGQVTVYGKGGKTRVVLLSPNTWRVLQAIRGGAGPDAPVFRSRKTGEPIGREMLHRIVKDAAARAGLSADVSAHWLRHAHASHSLDRGAPIHLVQATLGHASVATTGRYTHARPSDSSARYLGI